MPYSHTLNATASTLRQSTRLLEFLEAQPSSPGKLTQMAELTSTLSLISDGSCGHDLLQSLMLRVSTQTLAVLEEILGKVTTMRSRTARLSLVAWNGQATAEGKEVKHEELHGLLSLQQKLETNFFPFVENWIRALWRRHSANCANTLTTHMPRQHQYTSHPEERLNLMTMERWWNGATNWEGDREVSTYLARRLHARAAVRRTATSSTCSLECAVQK